MAKVGRPPKVAGGLTVNLTLRLSARIARDLRRHARFAGITVSDYVRGVVEKAMAIEEIGQ
jgi:hypothetical protein